MMTIVSAHRIKLSGFQYLPINESLLSPSINDPKLYLNSSMSYAPLCLLITEISIATIVKIIRRPKIDRTEDAY